MKTVLPDFERAVATLVLMTTSFGLTACHRRAAEPDDAALEHHLCLYGCPAGAPRGDRLIERSIYVLDNNGQTKFADWVAYEVTPQTLGGPSHKREWREDPDLPADETLAPQDYKGIREALHADRGHQAPLGSFGGSPDWAETNDLSNITPQATALNEGAWERLESAERTIVTREATDTFTVTGPLYERPMPKLPYAHLDHTVPSGYFKIIAVRHGNTVATAAFIMDQETPRKADFCAEAVEVHDVEQRAHLAFFPKMPEPERAQVEKARGALLAELGCTP